MTALLVIDMLNDYKTNLEDLLRDLAVEELILAGINTHACIRMAAIDAYQHDLEVIIARDCVASHDAEHHEVTLRYLNLEIAQVCDLKDLPGDNDILNN